MGNNEIIEDIYELSPMQEGMLFDKLLGKDKDAYFEQSSFRIIGSLEVELFEESINKLIKRYDVLRTLFIYENQKRQRQVVLKDAKIKIWFEDISSLISSEKTVFIKGFKEKDIDKGFDLSRQISIRASIIKTDEENYIFILSFHHIILDGWSLPIIFNELMYIYNSLKESMPLKLRKVNVYSNYIKWLQKQDKQEALVYWKKYLDGYEEQAQVLQTDKSFKNDKYINSEIKFSIGRELTDKLKGVAGKNKVTVNTIFQAVWGILLQRYNNVEDVVFGSVVSGRSAEIDGIENMVGLFINAVPVRIKSIVDKTFIELINEVHECSITSKKYEYVSLAEIQSSTSLKQQLIDNMMIFENYPVAKYSEKSENSKKFELKMELEEAVEQNNYNFNIIAAITDELLVKLSYNACIYDEQYVNMVAGHIEQIIKEVVDNPEIKLSEIEMLSEEEKTKILVDFNDTKAEYPKDKTIHELFEEQVEKTPENIAVVYQEKTLTYRELNE
ncbi:non-ribosomal peptide synthetase, partial [Clostridium estertheticum]